jgi:alpha-L-fucosidase
VKLGPQRSIVGDWKKAADQHGMKFGIAFHGDYSLWWYQPAFLSDLEGPKKGVPYDGARNYDGQETWWKKMGLDLKDLYGIDLKKEVTVPADWKDGETACRMKGALSHGIPNGNLRHHSDFATWYATKWTRRVIDAIDQFSPDFIYFDGGRSYPFCGAGTGKGLRADATPRVIAHLYNSNMARNAGKLEAMAFTKGNEDPHAVAVNVESGVPKGIKRDQPWQSENTIGEWFYKTGIRYDSGKVIRQMLNAVCRDGNYVVNVPLTPEGELDPGGLKTLKDMGDWMEINAEGIYDSSAWDIWGESASGQPAGGDDFRFTTKNGAVYAYLLAWPGEPKTTIRALGTGAGPISNVEMLGSKESLKWEQTPQGLVIHLPAEKPCQFAYGLKISGTNLHPAPGTTPPTGK